MFYVLWVVGVLFAIMLSVVVTISIEKTGKFDE
ncbi:cytochrome bd oxidase small subunit, CydX/CbdX family [Avibacterium paragallinarum]|uniref:Cytochrome bd oxidase small subunit, CydX/CbdX family n=1 Tax=Avibacterium paragallinarum TaxID=728 RepID=A0A2S5AVN1_AVIPA|nr:cytochrome bd oxidase small subunit, CydX/CbdX family [Avibacterium paragallinarum]AZI14902.1 cytochrome bd oxidase small subunit, CydX/CbdX family [Avibacterium paragallinarum]KAA6208823.1 cytochrome bd oxidase small subunit, CydX/CbdX family [Avibacterium paragallinarum]MEE3609649.1 cytochrome bd oxidase small subunit, CydX/CbdX family [Avibacterium paragallinarum]MEE3621786.1 cytochrome bd oxidase small subunit, CydX/CbdX family [Avibacterium paragallinarum]MEE3669399.1 cytochrome bd oxi